MAGNDRGAADATTRLTDLLTSQAREGAVVSGGVVDVAGGDRVSGRVTLSQRAMRSSALPMIYEKLWRPALFQAFTGRTTAKEIEHQLAALAPADGAVALDVACGPGNTTRRLARSFAGGLTVGADLSGTMLARAVADTDDDNIAYLRADAAALPFADRQFNMVACYGALYLVDEPFGVFDELMRVVAPGGRIALLTTCTRGPSGFRALSRVVTAPAGLRLFGPDDFTARLDAAGFRSIKRRVGMFSQTVSAIRNDA